MAKFTSPTMVRKPIWTWDTTNGLRQPSSRAITTGPPAAFTKRSSRRSGAAISLAKRWQVSPHVTDEIKAAFRKLAHDVDAVIIEIGGTVGDIESLPFLEAIRQMRLELGPENTIFVHVTLVPYIPTAGELKTKPTQHSVKEMLSIGIQPDLLICRSDRPLSADLKAKIALFCNVAESCVISAPDVGNIYE